MKPPVSRSEALDAAKDIKKFFKLTLAKQIKGWLVNEVEIANGPDSVK